MSDTQPAKPARTLEELVKPILEFSRAYGASLSEAEQAIFASPAAPVESEPANEPDELGAAARLLDSAPRYPQDYPDMTKAFIPEGYTVGTEAPEPALKAALLEDAKTTEPDARAVLRDQLADLLLDSDVVDLVLGTIDRYVDHLPVEPTPQRRITLDDLTPRHPDQSDNEYRRMAVGELVGAATVAWDSMQHTGVFHEATASSIVDALLELFDGQLSGLPHAQVEYVSAPLMDGMRGEALNHAVGIAKVSTNLGNMEATDTAGIVAQAEAFYAFLTGSSTPKSYPFEDGNVLVLGPELIAEPDGSVLNWKGQNYVTQPEPK